MFAPAKVQAQRAQALEAQRRAQQGLGRPIIGAEVAGHRFVAIGNRVFFDKQSKTFPDFLIRYLRVLLGPEWGNPELSKPETEMHPIALWYCKLALNQVTHAGKPGEVFGAPDTGASRAFLELAYTDVLAPAEGFFDELSDAGRIQGAPSCGHQSPIHRAGPGSASRVASR